MYIKLFHPHTAGCSCLERMGESGNKGCSNWKRRVTTWWSISRLVHKWLVKWLVYMFLNCIMLLSGTIFSSESVGRNFQRKWILWSIDSRPNNSRTSMNCLWTLRELLFCHCWNIVPLLRFLVLILTLLCLW